MRSPPELARALDAMSAPQRNAWLALAIIVALAVAVVIALRLHDAIGRSRENVARERLLLDVARARVAEGATLARANVSARNGDVPGAIDRVLTANGLRYSKIDAQRGDDAKHVVIDA